MAELSTLARPYAKAAFQTAKAQSQLTEWASALDLLAAMAQQEKIAELISNPAMTSEQKADDLCQLCGEELNKEQQNFVKILSDNKRLALLPEVAVQFMALKALAEKSMVVDVISAFELSEEMSEKLATELGKKLECDVEVQTSIDKDLLGGVLIRAGDLVIDGSVRGRLNKLAAAMNS